MKPIKICTYYYQQFDADFSKDVPAEGFGGWKKAELEINPAHTALVVMHAWDFGTREQYPGWHKTVEYIPRAYDICKNVFPKLLKTVRASEMKTFHVAVPNENLKKYPGYKYTVELTNERKDNYKKNDDVSKSFAIPERDEEIKKLWTFWSDNVVPGACNKEDVQRGFKNLDFPDEVKPLDSEGIAVNADQLFALCKKEGVNHLIYTGFAINGCLLVSPGGIIDMVRRGMMCSTIRQAVTAIENKETARNELAKELGLWFVSIISGFVYDIDDFIKALKNYNTVR